MWLLDGAANLGAYAGLPLGLLILLVLPLARPRVTLLACVPLIAWAGAITTTRLLITPAAGCAAEPTLRVATANVLYTNERLPELADRVLAQAPDILVLEELRADLESFSPALAAAYPHRLSTGSPWVTLASRYPLEDARRLALPEQVPGREPLAARIRVAGHAITLLAVHAVVPRSAATYREHVAQYEQLLQQVRGTTGPIVALGDFNATVLSPAFVRLLVAGDLRVAATTRAPEPTHFLFERLALRIDHVIARGAHVCAERVFDLPGSDHRGVAVDFALAAPAPSG